MPKIYKYLNIILFFHTREHDPPHVHGRVAEYESKAEFIMKDGKVIGFKIKKVRGKNPLRKADMANFEKFVELYKVEIVKKWVNVFIMQGRVTMETVNEL